MKPVNVRLSQEVENEQPEAARNAWPEAAATIAGVTAYGYLITFLYQYGQATFYGYPPEYNATSQEWTLFVISLLLLVLGAVWIALALGRGAAQSIHVALIKQSRTPEARLKHSVIVLLVFLILFAVTLTWVIMTTPPFGRAVFLLLLATAFALARLWEGRGSVIAWNWVLVFAAATMVLSALVGYGVNANTTTHHRIVGTDLLVLAIDGGGDSLVVAPYDPVTGVISREYSIVSTESSTVVVEVVETGRLTKGAVR